MNRHFILLILMFFLLNPLYADANRGISSSSSTLVNTTLSLKRRILRNGNLRFTFRLDVSHLSDAATCIHFLEIIPVTLRGALLGETVLKRVAITSKDSVVRWRDSVSPTRRTKNKRSEIHARVSSSCTEDDKTETINSNVASRYSCSNQLSGTSPKRQVRQLRDARVSKRSR